MPDPVEGHDVRGMERTTLHSTPQACPDSALAAKFDEGKRSLYWKDIRVINCNPLSFSKVMRIRKRLGWSLRDQKKKVLEQRPTALRFPRVIACLMRGLWAYRLRDGRAGVQIG